VMAMAMRLVVRQSRRSAQIGGLSAVLHSAARADDAASQHGNRRDTRNKLSREQDHLANGTPHHPASSTRAGAASAKADLNLTPAAAAAVTAILTSAVTMAPGVVRRLGLDRSSR
jgi:hypothetical protein